MNRAIQALERQYHSLRESLPALEAQGVTEEQLTLLRQAIATSRDNLNAALLGNLQDNDEETAALTAKMKALQTELDASLKQLNKVAKVLDLITKAVSVGSQMASKVVAL